MPSKRMNLLHEVRFVHIGFRTTFAPVFPKLRRSEPQYYVSTELDQMTTSAKKHHRFIFKPTMALFFTTSAMPVQMCHWSSMRDTIPA
jgi:hypothetical protein